VVSSGNSNGKDVQPAQDDTRFLSIYGVARLGAQASQNGAADFLMLVALVNVAIGVINLVPLLPFDGGHLAIAIYERIRSRAGKRHMADVSRLLPLTYAVVLVLSVLMVSTVYLDIVDPVGIR
jgi:membrane-associated protease RseP (regulator of RpoE activity)